MVTGMSGVDGLYPFGYECAPATPTPTTMDIASSGTPDELTDFLHHLAGRFENQCEVTHLGFSPSPGRTTDDNSAGS